MSAPMFEQVDHDLLTHLAATIRRLAQQLENVAEFKKGNEKLALEILDDARMVLLIQEKALHIMLLHMTPIDFVPLPSHE